MPPYKKLKSEVSSPKDTKIVSKTSTDSDSEGGIDWREECFGVRDINSYALRKNILTDVTFFVGAQKEIFHAHRLILALGSPVFEAMFYGPLAEKGESVTIPDVDPEGFHYLLKFLYSERAFFKDDIAAIKTAFAADKYCVTYLKERCERFLCNVEVCSSNVWIFLQNSIYLNLFSLRQSCLSFLKHNMERALQHSSFLDVNARTVEAVLCRNSFIVPERKLLESVIQWAHRNCNAEDKDSFKNTIMPLLQHISFRSLKAEEFVHYLVIKRLSEVLKSEDALAILTHILMPDLCPLPDWCSKTRRLQTFHVPQNCKTASSKPNSGFKKLTVRCRVLSSSNSTDSQNNSSSQSSSSSSGSSSSSSEFSD